MAVYTPLTLDEIIDIAADYGLGRVVESVAVPQGSENTTYRIKTTTDTHILTLYEGRTNPAFLPQILQFQDYLAQHQFPCAQPVQRTDGKFITLVKEKPLAICHLLDGQALSTPTPAHAEKTGLTLAEMHVLSHNYETRIPCSFGHKEAAALLDKIVVSAQGSSLDIARKLKAEQTRLQSAALPNLPHGIIHEDLFPDNVMFKNETLTGFIDFGFCCYGTFLYDLAIALNAWGFDDETGQFKPDIFQAFYDGYTSVRPLEQHEQENFGHMMCLGALRFATSRLYDLTFPPDEGPKDGKNPVSWLIRLEFNSVRRTLSDYV